MENDEILQDEEIQTTFNEDTIEELNEDNGVENKDGDVENENENELPKEQ